jgi:glycine/D-amino acid oxidase-like deaminating enzyme
LERDHLCSGGTGKSSGIVRCHYGAPALAKMAWVGVQLFENAEEALGTDVGFFQTGYVVGVDRADEAALRANVAMHQSLGIDARIATVDEIGQLWPYGDFSEFACFAYERRGGYGDAYLTGRAFAHAASGAGVEIREHSPVVELITGKSSNKVIGVKTASGERISAEAVVLAAGPWSVALATQVGVELPIRAVREQILLIDPGEPIVDAPVFSDIVNLQYIRTERSGQLLVGNSDHSAPEYIDPDDYANRADDDYIEAAVAKVDRLLPGLPNPGLATSYAGCYDVTPDFNPIMSEAPIEGLYICAGFSGHGFKISPAVGILMADIISDGTSRDADIPAADFRLSRFTEGQLLRSMHPYRRAAMMR